MNVYVVLHNGRIEGVYEDRKDADRAATQLDKQSGKLFSAHVTVHPLVAPTRTPATLKNSWIGEIP